MSPDAFTASADMNAGVVFLATSAVGAAAITVEHRRTPWDSFFDASSRAHPGADADLLRALAAWEHRDPKRPLTPVLNGDSALAISPPNKDGSRDYGVLQINSKTGQALGYTTNDLLSAQKNIECGARLMVLMRKELGAKLTIHNLISAWNVGTPTVLLRGIVNPAYVAGAFEHYILYKIGGLFR